MIRSISKRTVFISMSLDNYTSALAWFDQNGLHPDRKAFGIVMGGWFVGFVSVTGSGMAQSLATNHKEEV